MNVVLVREKIRLSVSAATGASLSTRDIITRVDKELGKLTEEQYDSLANLASCSHGSIIFRSDATLGDVVIEAGPGSVISFHSNLVQYLRKTDPENAEARLDELAIEGVTKLLRVAKQWQEKSAEGMKKAFEAGEAERNRIDAEIKRREEEDEIIQLRQRIEALEAKHSRK